MEIRGKSISYARIDNINKWRQLEDEGGKNETPEQ